MPACRSFPAAALVAVSIAACLAPTTAPTPVPSAGPFVTRSASELMLDGRAYRFRGFNLYNANSDGWCRYENSPADLRAAFDELGRGGALRAWFFQPLAARKSSPRPPWSGTRDWTRFDRTLAIARQKGVRVVATLTDQWSECGDGGVAGFKTADWYEAGYMIPDPLQLEQYTRWVSYRDWVRAVVSRYRDDPTILAWQLINEAVVNSAHTEDCPAGDGPAEILKAWAGDVSGVIRSLDPNHLISLGTIGTGQCGTAGAQYQSVHDLPNIDLCEYHDYTAAQAMPGDASNGLQRRIDQCAALGKPIFVGEVGITPNEAGGTLEDRARVLAEKLAVQSAAGVVGHLAWDYSREGSTLDAFDIGPGDPVLEVLRDGP